MLFITMSIHFRKDHHGPWPKGKSASFHCVSIIRMMKNKIVSLVEYWSDDGPAPQWRKKMGIGKPIENEHLK